MTKEDIKITNSNAIGIGQWEGVVKTDLGLNPKTRPKAKISDVAQNVRPVAILFQKVKTD